MYQCINCGYEGQATEKMHCPKCKHNMFEKPFDRKEFLINEIKKVIKCRCTSRFGISNAEYYRKMDYVTIPCSKDFNRKPSFAEIKKYVFSAKSCDQFKERICKIIERMRTLYSEKYEQTYTADFKKFSKHVDDDDEIVSEFLKIFDIEHQIPNVVFPKTELYLLIKPDQSKLNVALDSFEIIKKLASAVTDYAKVNNCFSSILNFEISEDIMYKDKVIDADYITGQNEESVSLLNEFGESTNDSLFTNVLECMWSLICDICIFRVQIVERTYIINGAKSISEKEYKDVIRQTVETKYSFVYDLISDNFLQDKSESEVYEYYKKVDKIDYMYVLKEY